MNSSQNFVKIIWKVETSEQRTFWWIILVLYDLSLIVIIFLVHLSIVGIGKKQSLRTIFFENLLPIGKKRPHHRKTAFPAAIGWISLSHKFGPQIGREQKNTEPESCVICLLLNNFLRFSFEIWYIFTPFFDVRDFSSHHFCQALRTQWKGTF